MAIYDHLATWAGKPVADFDPETGIDDPGGTLYRLRVEFESGNKWADVLAAFLADPRSCEVTGLIVGAWDPDFEQMDSSDVVEALSSAADRLPNVTALFFGDITSEEDEISWIRQSDLSPLLNAFPNLEHFGVRGGNGLSLGRPHLPHLRTLVVQAGGLPLSVVHEVLAAGLPALEHLEIWLGEDHYGAEATADDLKPIFEDKERWPRLTYLGLRNSDIADAIAAALVDAPILQRLKVLDLSMGTLTDAGAEALAANPAIARLEKLDIHHHFVSPEGVAKLEALGIAELDADERQDGWDDEEPYRYVAHGE